MFALARLGRAFVAGVSAAALLSAAGCGGGGGGTEAVQPSGPTASVEGGMLEGVDDGSTVAFMGIPYAAAPTGDLRWKPPVSSSVWSGTRRATAFADKCPQVDDHDVYSGSEDCLFVNVWARSDSFSAPGLRPVFFYIHGGSNERGSASEVDAGVTAFDGTNLAERGDVVVVTAQYRLGVFGFLTLPELAAESPQGVSGNYGLLDQIAALQWVQRNIAAFGGDADNVTVVGHSAGARDVCVLVASPLAAGLFNKAIIESGYCGETTAADRNDTGNEAVQNAGCDGGNVLSCMRSMDASDLVKRTTTNTITALGLVTPGFGANVDGYVLPEDPLTMLQDGTANNVALLLGVNHDETASFGIPPIGADDYADFVRTIVGDDAEADQVLAMYPVGDYDSPRDALIALTTDAQFTCPARRIARASSGQGHPTFLYQFDHALTGSTFYGDQVPHGLELLFVFQHVDELEDYSPTTDDHQLESDILSYWTTFAASADPNSGTTTTWPAFDGDEHYLALDVPATVGSDLRGRQCDLWDQLAPAP